MMYVPHDRNPSSTGDAGDLRCNVPVGHPTLNHIGIQHSNRAGETHECQWTREGTLPAKSIDWDSELLDSLANGTNSLQRNNDIRESSAIHSGEEPEQHCLGAANLQTVYDE